MKITKYIIWLFALIIFIFCIKGSIKGSIKNEEFEVSQIEIVIARYNENLEWMKEKPFLGHSYIVYNKGPNEDFYKSDDLKAVVSLENVGREGHTYLYHIIHNYDSLSEITVFLPGSVEMPHKYNRSKDLLKYIKKRNTSALACASGFGAPGDSVYDMFKDFQIDDYLSSNENNKKVNADSSMKKSEIRPFGKWYKATFGQDAQSNCFTMNGILAISKEDILKNPKSHYETLIRQLDDHQTPKPYIISRGHGKTYSITWTMRNICIHNNIKIGIDIIKAK
jgi:hypothetical protein